MWTTRIKEVAAILLNSASETQWLTVKQLRERAGINYNTRDKTLLEALRYLIETGDMEHEPPTTTTPHLYRVRSKRK